MNKKFLLILPLMLFMVTGNLFAQLSDRENTNSTIRTGTRPLSGDMGVYVGISSADILAIVDSSINLTYIPIINFKYYVSDNIVARISYSGYKRSQKLTGTLLNTDIGFEDNSFVMSRYLFTPDIEYHFNSKNLIDVYVGAGIPFGFDKDYVYVTEKYSLSGDYSNVKTSRKSRILGIEFFIGMQAFIADLPWAVGLEFGSYGLGHFNQVYKYEINNYIAGINSNQVYYTTGKDANLPKYSELSKKSFEFMSNVRFSINYYFFK